MIQRKMTGWLCTSFGTEGNTLVRHLRVYTQSSYVWYNIITIRTFVNIQLSGSTFIFLTKTIENTSDSFKTIENIESILISVPISIESTISQNSQYKVNPNALSTI